MFAFRTLGLEQQQDKVRPIKIKSQDPENSLF
jgi:hypothetical protein